jgi:TonB family protein
MKMSNTRSLTRTNLHHRLLLSLLGIFLLSGCLSPQAKDRSKSRSIVSYSDAMASSIQARLGKTSADSQDVPGGTVVLGITVSREGAVESAIVLHSSGIAELDSAALQAAKSVRSFGPLPDNVYANLQSASIDIPITRMESRVTSDTSPSIQRPQPSQSPAAAPTPTLNPNSYYSVVYRMILQTTQYPPAALNAEAEGTAIVRLKVGLDGSIQRVWLIKSTAHAVLDMEAIQVFYRIRKFPPIPTEIALAGADSFLLEMPIAFGLTN